MDAGWGIDTHKIASFGGKKATVIPSPARRENPEMAHAWVLKEVPTTGEEAGEDRGVAELIDDDTAGGKLAGQQ
jgi:hypothetical protein